jgi:hypothetical protein
MLANALIIVLAVLLCLIVVSRLLLRGVARRALAKVVTDIRLHPLSSYQFSDQLRADRVRQDFAQAEFPEAGMYSVEGIDGLVVLFFLRSEPSMYGVLYDYPKKGMFWTNLVLLFDDDTSATITDQPDRGMTQRPGHEILHSPGESVATMVEAARRYVQGKSLKHLSEAQLPELFERAYREGLAWRKQQGISVQEVINVAKTRQREE